MKICKHIFQYMFLDLLTLEPSSDVPARDIARPLGFSVNSLKVHSITLARGTLGVFTSIPLHFLVNPFFY